MVNNNIKYNLKTLKVRPDTHKRIIRCKAKIERSKGELLSFDKVVGFLVDNFFEKNK